MPLTVREFDTVVNKLEMKPREGKHKFLWFVHDEKHVLWTMRSQGRGEIGAVEHAVRKQLNVTGPQMNSLVDCTMTRKDYIEHLRLIGAIEPKDE